MTELSGTLEGVGLPAIVRFLSGLKKTGCLRIAYNDWRGEVFFDQGLVTGASLGSRRGLTALDGLVQALPSGSFTFDGSVPVGGSADISLSADEMQAHLDDLAQQSAHGTSRLPSFDAVPAMVGQDNSSSGEEPLPLDRGTLQTLLAIDGRRTVGEIVAQRGSMDVLWHLASLVEVGLVRMGSDGATAQAEVTPAPPSSPEAAAPEDAPTLEQHVETPAVETHIETASVEQQVEAPAVEAPSVEAIAPAPEPVLPTIARPFAQDVVVPDASAHCPKLGFEDDPNTSFGRPTRMHRCYAAGTPLPLSLDQQRELCLSDQYATCPRLTMGGFVPPARDAQSASDATVFVRRPGPGLRPSEPEGTAGLRRPESEGGAGLRRPEPEGSARSRRTEPEGSASPRRNESESDDPRIVRLPFVTRATAAERGAVADRQAVGGTEPTRFRSAGSPVHDAGSTPPTPLRARLERTTGAAADIAVAELPNPPTSDPHATESAFVDEVLVNVPVERRVAGIPVGVIAGGAVIVVVLAVIVFLLGPHVGDWFADDSVDPSVLPNTSAVAAGTPIAQFTSARATTVARATAEADTSDAAASKTDPSTAGATTAASAASASAAAPAPTLPPEPGQANTQPAPGKPAPAVPAQPAASGAPASTGPAAAAQPKPNTLVDERFANNDRNWPSNPQGTAFVSNGSYRLAPRQAGQFVAVGAPVADQLKDVVINATFHKLSGPPGGGYGIIVRDQASVPQNGTSQDGRYYVLEVGDKGEVGMWRRDGDHWVDLLPWQPNAAVKADTGSNDLSVRAIGNRLSLSVNGTLVAAKTDDTFAAGGVGLFVGGDGNQVAVDRFSIQTP